MATTTALALDSGTRLGPYEILAPVGSGGMGEVYRARDTRLDRLVAVKVLPKETASPQALERFEREAKAIAALNHPGICAIYDVGTAPAPFLVMELLEGETLHSRLQRGPLDIAALIDIGLLLADALATAHAKGIIHRDLKPANIFLTAHGPKILDFGLARVTEAAVTLDVEVTARATLAAPAPLTDAGVAVGTVSYMSPEQLRGETLDARTDLFSLGVALYEVATGRRAFGGATTAVTSAAILHEQPVAPRQLRTDLPVKLEQTILTLLEKDREVRTQTASELRAELTRVKRELSGARAFDTAIPRTPVSAGGVSPPATAMVAAPPGSSDAQLIVGVIRRHRRAVAIAVAMLLAAVVAVSYFGRSGAPAAPATEASGLSIANLQVEQLTTSGTADVPAVSPDGNYVVYIERGSGRDSLRVRQVATGSNVELVPAETGTALRGATVTPDGVFVNYVKQVGVQAFELWQIPFLGGTARRLLQGGRVGYSPDGRQMAYVRATGTDRTEVLVAASDGSGERALAVRQLPKRFWPGGPNTSYAPAWSPDGATLAMIGGRDAVTGGRGGESSTGQLVFVDVKSGSERTVDVGPRLLGAGVQWLADDTLLVSMVDRPSALLQLWLVSYPAGTLRRLTNDTSQYVGVSLTADRNTVVTARAGSSFGIWTSDATVTKWSQAVPARSSKGAGGFAVRWIGGDLMYVSSPSRGFALMRWHASTQSEEVLAPSSGNASVSRDGSRILFVDHDLREMWTMDSKTQNRVRVRSGVEPLLEVPHLTPDGQHYVTLSSGAGNAPTVVHTAIDGRNSSREITNERVRLAAGPTSGRVEVSPDGEWIAFPSMSDGNQPVTAVCDLAACSSRRTLSTVPGTRWRWMPDSKALAYIDTKTQSDLWVQPLDGSPPRQLTHFASDGHQIWDFDWSADGRRLAVARGKTSTDIVLFRGLRTRN